MYHTQVVILVLMFGIILTLWIMFIINEVRLLRLSMTEQYYQRPLHKGPPVRFERRQDITRPSIVV